MYSMVAGGDDTFVCMFLSNFDLFQDFMFNAVVSCAIIACNFAAILAGVAEIIARLL